MDNGEDVWVRYAPLIKSLYQEERKTLSQVKAILENEHGFPKTPYVIFSPPRVDSRY